MHVLSLRGCIYRFGTENAASYERGGTVVCVSFFPSCVLAVLPPSSSFLLLCLPVYPFSPPLFAFALARSTSPSSPFTSCFIPPSFFLLTRVSLSSSSHFRSFCLFAFSFLSSPLGSLCLFLSLCLSLSFFFLSFLRPPTSSFCVAVCCVFLASVCPFQDLRVSPPQAVKRAFLESPAGSLGGTWGDDVWPQKPRTLLRMPSCLALCLSGARFFSFARFRGRRQ
ncbi:putative transmembrane protein [Toxoplasma gondii MAS]|uniref:Putative transmembrane protein n=1 Tax=Toxoplasma gondii MAS TaxID=943118 RepID=A0A086QWQ4_TOXGO|nr:putative transmembrane protein [Toxoplasma gondii MAS]